MSGAAAPAVGRARPLALVAAGVGAGLLSGLLGVGGGIVLVPLLVLLFGFAQKQAQATSLVAIILTATTGVVSYAVAGEVQVLPALAIAAGGIAGAFVGAALVHRLSETQVRTAFAVLMVAVAVRLALGVEADGGAGAVSADGWAVLGFVAAGLAMGTLSSLVGVGGGIILVPMLVLLFAFATPEAQGTSLAVIIPVSLVGAWRNSRHGYTQWRPGLVLGLGGAMGAPVGAALALALPAVGLQRIFAVLLVLSAVQLVRTALRSRAGR
ncbi:sulfite exporter TauE/SafE family protein [Georgenia faecalis]|uniref:sulfite exporter TauE/SafE family protein n=1 Tax=Georgenia faecalis TaxID=2483799 RepID=UPI000FD8059D|nr:sulfite exporter TauE/SafE family protein [Georgenia faecalis]